MDLSTIDFSKARVLVFGDVMLDQYWHGGTSRISPEAPVPVVHVNRVDEKPGGAANVALGVSALGAKAYLLGLIGDDEAGRKLEQLVSGYSGGHKIVTHLKPMPQANTITKLRILSRNQQMIRLDREKEFFYEHDEPLSQSVLDLYKKLLTEVDIVILSDYGKGTLKNPQPFIRLARTLNIPVLIDPKSNDFETYKGASVLTPNLKEFEAVVGSSGSIDTMVSKAKTLIQKCEIDALVITRSEAGMSVIPKTDSVTHIPAQTREVHDVTGAGDTVLAVLGVALAAGLNLTKAATLGNCAAGIAVGKLGTATVTYTELQRALGENQFLSTGVMTEENLLNAVRISKARGERIIFTNGCFDILHAGHILYLQEAKRLGDRVIVAVNDDASVKRLKGANRPLNPLEERMSVLAGLKSVDWVVSFSEDTPSRLIQAITPDCLVKGGDYQIIQEIPGAAYVLSTGGEVKVLSYKEGISTTRLIEKIQDKRNQTETVV